MLPDQFAESIECHAANSKTNTAFLIELNVMAVLQPKELPLPSHGQCLRKHGERGRVATQKVGKSVRRRQLDLWSTQKYLTELQPYLQLRVKQQYGV